MTAPRNALNQNCTNSFALLNKGQPELKKRDLLLHTGVNVKAPEAKFRARAGVKSIPVDFMI